MQNYLDGAQYNDKGPYKQKRQKSEPWGRRRPCDEASGAQTDVFTGLKDKRLCRWTRSQRKRTG